MSRILVTGAAGFIGFHVCRRYLAEGAGVIGVDSLNDYYEVQLKRDRLAQLESQAEFSFHHFDLADRDKVADLFDRESLTTVIHLAAQAGVRYSLTNPHAYVDSNLVAFVNVLEGCRHTQVKHLVYASSSSVYGSNTLLPFAVEHNVDHPISLYAATKKANELMAHTYSHLYGLPTTGLRFFTVYGPWGRPDMAMYIFTRKVSHGEPIDVYNNGNMQRDFTYIDDIVTGIQNTAANIPTPDENWSSDMPNPASSQAPYRVYNIGNNQPVELMYVIEQIEKHVGKLAIRNMMPIQPGDVQATFADVDALVRDVDFRPNTPIETGIERFVQWYREYHGIESFA